MSSRALKKLQPNDLPAPVDSDDAAIDVLSDDEELFTSRRSGCKNLNKFELFNQDSPSESEVKEDDNETEHTSAAANLPSGSAGVNALKKKKKKRKKKTKRTANHISSEDNEKSYKDSDPLLDKLATATNEQNKKANIERTLLTVELRNLNPHNEMRRTFGKRVVKTENKRGRQKLILKTTHLVTAKETWPPILKNILSMKIVPPPDEANTASSTATTPTTPTSPNIIENATDKRPNRIQWYAFEHSQLYQHVQNVFLRVVQNTDSDYLVNVVKGCPYHLDSLVQLSELCKMSEDYSMAGELIERACLMLEISLHPTFSFTSGNCRLDYRRQENRSLFIILFKQAQYLEARACVRTAFEISKLILSISPDVDPLAMVLILDYYAIRSNQFAWLVEYYEHYDAIRNLSQLPNMAYSYALSLFCLKQEPEKANEALQYALMMFPGVLKPLLDEMSIHPDKRILGSSYFISDVTRSQSPALQQLVSLYVCRAKVIWRQDDVLPWLETNVGIVLDLIEAKDKRIEEFKQKRAARYVTPPRPILRHVILSDYKEKVPLAPFLSKEKDGILACDPLPPTDSINTYNPKSSNSSASGTNNGSISMFFQSLLPSMNFNQAPAGRPANERPQNRANQRQLAEIERFENFVMFDDGGPPPGLDVQQSLNNILEAMRDFLQNFHINDPLEAEDLDDNTEEEDTTD